jgi:outer membrane murein-binding lipoprotein Lpp
MSLLAVLLSVLVLTGCVTAAQQSASQSDISIFARSLDQDPFSNLDPEAFRETAEKALETPIDFHGVVRSDAGNPLRGAKVTATVFDHLVDPFEFPYFAFTTREPIYTDAQGRFRFTKEKGAAMYVLVEVPGWAPMTAPRKLYTYADNLDPDEGLPRTADAPVEFVFEDLPPEKQLRPIRTGALRFEDDGVPLELSLREVAPYGVDPGTGEAIITCHRTLENAAPDAKFDWWCELTIPGGGFQQFKINMDRAPETGYVETGRLEMKADDERWDDRADRNLIVRFADGMYGMMRLAMRMDGDFYVAVDGVWNPTGARWLD